MFDFKNIYINICFYRIKYRMIKESSLLFLITMLKQYNNYQYILIHLDYII